MHIFVIFLLIFISFIQASTASSDSEIVSTKFSLNYGGITLAHNGRFYEITTKECPGGIFLTQPVNETCLCYNGIFSIVREFGEITTDTIEWRKNFQCGISPEIGEPGNVSIKAILPLTKSDTPFRPVITFKEFSGDNFKKWRKFDANMLSITPEPIVFKDASNIEIINIRPLKNYLHFKMGKYGDVDICYEGWKAEGPQSLRISIYTYEKPKHKSGICCFEVDVKNAPGIIHSKCRGGSIVTELVDIESVNTGNACPNQGHSERSQLVLELETDNTNEPTDLIRFKRSPMVSMSTLSAEVMSEVKRVVRADPLDPPPKPRYPLDDLKKDDLDEQHRKLREFTKLRRRNVTGVKIEPYSQRFILLKKSFQLFKQLVPEKMVPPLMEEDAFEAFFFLYESLDLDTERLTELEFQRVLDCLGNCSEKHTNWNNSDEVEVRYIDGPCPYEAEYIIVKHSNGTNETVNPCPTPPEALKWDLTKHDVIVEMNWKYVDFVHSMCFEEFFDDYNAHHFYENQMEILFLSSIIQDRWFREISDLEYTKLIIAEWYLESRMKEIDKAIGIAHYLSRYKDYLNRPENKTIDPDSKLFGQVQRYERALEERLLKLKVERHDDGDIVDFDPNNGDEGPFIPRTKKHIGSVPHRINKLRKRPTIELAKPGDIIWNGLGVCLDAGSNDDPAYYTQEELWGTRPSLSELQKKYKLK